MSQDFLAVLNGGDRASTTNSIFHIARFLNSASFDAISKHHAYSRFIMLITQKKENRNRGRRLCFHSNFLPTIFFHYKHSDSFLNTFSSNFYGRSNWLIVALNLTSEFIPMVPSLAQASHGITFRHLVKWYNSQSCKVSLSCIQGTVSCSHSHTSQQGHNHALHIHCTCTVALAVLYNYALKCSGITIKITVIAIRQYGLVTSLVMQCLCIYIVILPTLSVSFSL